jgi:hypothetical protein
MVRKLKPKKLLKDVSSLFAMSGKKGKKMKSLFVIGGGGSNMYPSYGVPKKRSKRRRRVVY